MNEEDKARAACVGPTRTEELRQGEGADLLGHSGPRDTSGSKARPCPVPWVFVEKCPGHPSPEQPPPSLGGVFYKLLSASYSRS